MRDGREEGWVGREGGGVGGRRGWREEDRMNGLFTILRFCQGTDEESCAQTSPSSREEKGSGVTSPNPWAIAPEDVD